MSPSEKGKCKFRERASLRIIFSCIFTRITRAPNDPK
jgi:hypothetical protein